MNFKKVVWLTKADERSQTIEGICGDETPDLQNEILDYESSKPHFQEFSRSALARSGGKSAGALRLMHQPVIAGALTELHCDDLNKSFPVKAWLTPECFELASRGAITGLSVGGQYLRRWRSETDPPGVRRYTAQPVEVSLCDTPANPNAGLTIAKFAFIQRNGSVQLRKFAPARESESGQYASTSDGPCHNELIKRGFELQRSDGSRSDYVHPTGHRVSVHRTGSAWYSLPPGRSAPHSGQGPRELADHLDGERRLRKEFDRLRRFPVAFMGKDGSGMTEQEAASLISNREPVAKNLGGVEGLLREVITATKRPQVLTISPWR